MIKSFRLFLVLITFSFLGLFSTQCRAAEVYYTEEDRAIFDRYLSAMASKTESSVEDLIIETALFFLGTPYVGATLEKEPEGLVINLREMDCTTFVENVITLARTVKEGNASFDGFCRNLQQLRYRQGEITDYTDRLHYTTDWIYANERKGLVKDITREIGGEPLPLNLSFMSTHPDSYRQLKDHPERIKVVAAQEKEISARTYYYIPESEIARLATRIQNGNIVGFVTTVGGLDLSHVGIAYWQDGELTFIHASSSAAKKVLINPDPLAAYVKRIKSNKGIMVIQSQR